MLSVGVVGFSVYTFVCLNVRLWVCWYRCGVWLLIACF